jgi:hypothetical protein
MSLVDSSLLADEQVRANSIIREVATLLQCPTSEETLAELSEIPVLGAEYSGWQLHAYLELEDEELDKPLGFWVLIISSGEERASRVFEGTDFEQVAHHVRRFVEDAAYRRNWLYSSTSR